MLERNMRMTRTTPTKFETREEDGGLFIEGYFAVFNSIYPLWDGYSETVAPEAFSNTLGNDIRCLTNHDTTLVLGRNKAGTLELKEDSHGLWGKVRINEKDQDAMNLYHRVQRGDVNQCSFGFEIAREEFETKGTGGQWIIREVNLFEVTVATFPAYEETGVMARMQQAEEIEKRKGAAWKEAMRDRVKGGKKDAENTTA